MSALSPDKIDEPKIIACLEYALKCSQALGERAAGLAIEDALDDLKTRFRLHPHQVAEDQCELAYELEMERR